MVLSDCSTRSITPSFSKKTPPKQTKGIFISSCHKHVEATPSNATSELCGRAGGYSVEAAGGATALEGEAASFNLHGLGVLFGVFFQNPPPPQL